jgi:hypothetical protein
MKKFSFTVQVFGLMAILPMFVILEMNHGTGRLSVNNSRPIVKEKVEKTITPEAIYSDGQQTILIAK